MLSFLYISIYKPYIKMDRSNGGEDKKMNDKGDGVQLRREEERWNVRVGSSTYVRLEWVRRTRDRSRDLTYSTRETRRHLHRQIRLFRGHVKWQHATEDGELSLALRIFLSLNEWKHWRFEICHRTYMTQKFI